MYEILNINGERTEAEILDMLLDNEHGVSLSHVMGELNLYPNQARNCIARLEYIPASNPKQYYVIDKWHRRNHVCEKRRLTSAERRRVSGINSSISEQSNGYMRKHNFWLNYLRPCAHRFWVQEIIRFYNRNTELCLGVYKCKPRTNARTRAAMGKRKTAAGRKTNACKVMKRARK